jgi:hypothetical protein
MASSKRISVVLPDLLLVGRKRRRELAENAKTCQGRQVRPEKEVAHEERKKSKSKHQS